MCHQPGAEFENGQGSGAWYCMECYRDWCKWVATPPLHYSATVPTVSGWYWIKGVIVSEEDEILFVKMVNDRPRIIIGLGYYDCNTGMQFAGPIPQPQDPTNAN